MSDSAESHASMSDSAESHALMPVHMYVNLFANTHIAILTHHIYTTPAVPVFLATKDFSKWTQVPPQCSTLATILN
jgi:hypothetical protein